MFRIIFLSTLFFFIIYGVYSFFSRYLGGSERRQRTQQNKNEVPIDPKHFSKDVGEYVSYEEIKDEDQQKK